MVQEGNLYWLPRRPRIRSTTACRLIGLVQEQLGAESNIFLVPVTTGRCRHAVSASASRDVTSRRGPCQAMGGGRMDSLGSSFDICIAWLFTSVRPLLMSRERITAHDLRTRSSPIVVPTDPGFEPKAEMLTGSCHNRPYKRGSQATCRPSRGSEGKTCGICGAMARYPRSPPKSECLVAGRPRLGVMGWDGMGCVSWRLASQSACARLGQATEKAFCRAVISCDHAPLRPGRRRLGNATALV